MAKMSFLDVAERDERSLLCPNHVNKPYMLAKQKRITKQSFPRKADFRLSDNTLSATITHINQGKIGFSVVISKKVAKLAVTRNKARRRIYAILESYSTTTSPMLIVIYVKKSIENLTNQELKEEIKRLFHQTPLDI